MQRVHFQVGVGVFNCEQMLTKISFVIIIIIIIIIILIIIIIIIIIIIEQFLKRIIPKSQCFNKNKIKDSL